MTLSNNRLDRFADMKKKTLPETIQVQVSVSYEVDNIIEGLDPEWERDEISLELVLEWVKLNAAEDLAACADQYDVLLDGK